MSTEKDSLEFAHFLEVAEQGDAFAQLGVGLGYYEGKGVSKDRKLSIEWFRKAAMQGNASGQHCLAVALADGDGVPKDAELAAQWYRKAADQGHAPAQENLGHMYANGRGVPQDHKLAVDCYQKAAAQGRASAQEELGAMYAIGLGVPRDLIAAADWFEKAAAQGRDRAQYTLSLVYEKGNLGRPQDYQLAVDWRRKAANQGHMKAQESLRELEETMLITPSDTSQPTKSESSPAPTPTSPTLIAPMGPVVAPSPIADGPASPLTKLHRLLQEKTRFEPEDIKAEEEVSLSQSFQISVKHELDARVHNQKINGNFRPSSLDHESSTPEYAAEQERRQRIELAYTHLQTILRIPETAYNDIENGCLLKHTSKHWQLDTCDTCNGDGEVVCDTCHGQREETCNNCYGALRVKCDAFNCIGGSAMCMYCNGLGQVQKTESVWVGNTTQYQTVTSKCTAIGCNFGRVFCQRCVGSGQINCGTCFARGRITCRTCGGRGNVTCSPCSGTRKVGNAAWVDVVDTPSYRLDLPQNADPDAATISEKEGGPHGIAAICADGLHLENLTKSIDSQQVVADYAGKLDIAHLKANCNGRQYALTAYGKDLRWLSMNGIVEDLLRRDLADLQSAIAEAGEDGIFSTRLDHILSSLKHIAASELNADLVESALGVQATSGDHSNVVSPEYARQVQTGIFGSLRFIYNRLAMKHGWQIWTAFGAAGLACWLFSASWLGALVALCAIPAGKVLFERKVRSTLTEALGDEQKALRAMNIARRSKRTRFSAGIIMAPPIVLAVLFVFMLPAAGPWGGKPTATSTTSAARQITSTPVDRSQQQAVDTALVAYKAGRYDEAREQLLKLARAGNTAAFGPLAWMGVDSIPVPSNTTRERLHLEAVQWADKAMIANANDLWAIAARGIMLRNGYAMPSDPAGGMRLLHKAAEAGHGGAMHNLGHIYLHAQRNVPEARKWYASAAALGQPGDIYNLGLMDWYGLGGPRDTTSALKLWKNAAALGEERAIKAVRLGRPPD